MVDLVAGRAQRIALAALVVLAGAADICRADTVASLLGNFTINQYTGLRVAGGSADLSYTVVFGQLPALRELHLADADGDGVTSQQERDDYARRLAPTFAEGLALRVDGVAVPLRATHWTTSLPTEQGGFSLRLDVHFTAALPASGDGVHRLTLANQNYAGRFGWQEMVVDSASGVAIFDTDAFSTSLTSGLTEALQTVPAAGPLAERSVHLAYRLGDAPAGTTPIAPRSGTSASPVAAASIPSTDMSSWLVRQTRRLVELISTPTVPLHIALVALLGAIVLGALHAFSPGHGKTVVGAYLIGSRGTPRHAAFLGVTVTITHTLGVFALGFATLFASRFLVPERLLPVLSLASGFLVLSMGLVLLAKRWRGARDALREPRPMYRALDSAAMRVITPLREMAGAGAFAYAQARGVAAGHDHPLPHDHARHHNGRAYRPFAYDHGHGEHSHHRGALVHSHGGSVHSHLPPGAHGDRVTWRSLLALGVSGGLVPCPSALVVLLAAIALNKTAYGLLLVMAFSVGLAGTLTGVGLAFLYARDRIGWRPGTTSRWVRLLPVASAAAITVVGMLMCYGAIVTTGA